MSRALPIFLRNSDGSLLEIGSWYWNRPFSPGYTTMFRVVDPESMLIPPLESDPVRPEDPLRTYPIVFEQAIIRRRIGRIPVIRSLPGQREEVTAGLVLIQGSPQHVVMCPEWSPERIPWVSPPAAMLSNPRPRRHVVRGIPNTPAENEAMALHRQMQEQGERVVGLDRLNRAEPGSWLFPPDADRTVPTPDCDEAKPQPLAPLADWMRRADDLIGELTS